MRPGPAGLHEAANAHDVAARAWEVSSALNRLLPEAHRHRRFGQTAADAEQEAHDAQHEADRIARAATARANALRLCEPARQAAEIHDATGAAANHRACARYLRWVATLGKDDALLATA